MGKVPRQQLIKQVNGPEYIMYDRQDDGMVVIPAYHDRIDAQDAIKDAFVSVVHA